MKTITVNQFSEGQLSVTMFVKSNEIHIRPQLDVHEWLRNHGLAYGIDWHYRKPAVMLGAYVDQYDIVFKDACTRDAFILRWM